MAKTLSFAEFEAAQWWNQRLPDTARCKAAEAEMLARQQALEASLAPVAAPGAAALAAYQQLMRIYLPSAALRARTSTAAFVKGDLTRLREQPQQAAALLAWMQADYALSLRPNFNPPVPLGDIQGLLLGLTGYFDEVGNICFDETGNASWPIASDTSGRAADNGLAELLQLALEVALGVHGGGLPPREAVPSGSPFYEADDIA